MIGTGIGFANFSMLEFQILTMKKHCHWGAEVVHKIFIERENVYEIGVFVKTI